MIAFVDGGNGQKSARSSYRPSRRDGRGFEPPAGLETGGRASFLDDAVQFSLDLITAVIDVMQIKFQFSHFLQLFIRSRD